jgi:glutamate dehydrogenase
MRIGQLGDLARGLAVTDYYDELALGRAIEALNVAQRRIAMAVLKDATAEGSLDQWLGRRSAMLERVLAEVTAIAEGGVAPSVSAIGVAAGQIADLAGQA